MKNFRLLSLIALFVIVLFTSASGQDNLQNIFKSEYNNPAFNSFKDYSTVSLLARNQWGSKVTGSPEVYGLNFHTPLHKRLGMGLQVFSEELGLRSHLILSGSLSHYVQVGEDNYLGFGYSVGIEHSKYDRTKIYEDNPDIILMDNDLNSQIDARASIGFFYLNPYFYSGISMTNSLNSEYSEYKVFRDFDFVLGHVFEFDNDILFKPEFSVKYYRIKEQLYEGGQYSESNADPIYNLSANVMLFNRIWFGLAQRFNYAQTYSLDFYINKSLKMGYTFERGIGNGINQFNNHVFGITWNFGTGKSRIFEADSNSTQSSTDGYINPSMGNKLYK